MKLGRLVHKTSFVKTAVFCTVSPIWKALFNKFVPYFSQRLNQCSKLHCWLIVKLFTRILDGLYWTDVVFEAFSGMKLWTGMLPPRTDVKVEIVSQKDENLQNLYYFHGCQSYHNKIQRHHVKFYNFNHTNGLNKMINCRFFHSFRLKW